MKGWLVIKYCTSPFPVINPMLEVEVAICAYNYRKTSGSVKGSLAFGTFSNNCPALFDK